MPKHISTKATNPNNETVWPNVARVVNGHPESREVIGGLDLGDLREAEGLADGLYYVLPWPVCTLNGPFNDLESLLIDYRKATGIEGEYWACPYCGSLYTRYLYMDAEGKGLQYENDKSRDLLGCECGRALPYAR